MSRAATLGEGTTKPEDVVKIDREELPTTLSSTSHAENLGEVQPQVAMKLGEQVNLPSLRTQWVRLMDQKSGTVVPQGLQIAEDCRIHLQGLTNMKT